MNRETKPKQSTRMLKAACGADNDGEPCGYTVRLSKKWAVGMGACCPVHGAMEVEGPTDAKKPDMTVTPSPVPVSLIDKVARAIMIAQGCGLTKYGQRVFCDNCDCHEVARAAVDTIVAEQPLRDAFETLEAAVKWEATYISNETDDPEIKRRADILLSTARAAATNAERD